MLTAIYQLVREVSNILVAIYQLVREVANILGCYNYQLVREVGNILDAISVSDRCSQYNG